MFKRRFIDTDRLVVRRCGKSVTEILRPRARIVFASSRPRRSVRSKASAACWFRAGGIVETPVNIELMHEMVRACTSRATSRFDCQIRRSDTRPDFRSPEHAARLFDHRRPLYRQAADLTLDIRNKSFEDVSYLCAEMLLERGLL
ncbi:MAG: shikimate kinase [Collinsella aerofaciens]